MNANLGYWLFAYLLMSVTLVIGFQGIRLAKAGRLEEHARKMTMACNLLLFFVFSYVVKALLLGREIKDGWSTLDFTILYTHESFIAIMLVTGTMARLYARTFRVRLDNPTGDDSALRRKHMLVGKIAYTAGVCALISATFVLWVLVRHLPAA